MLTTSLKQICKLFLLLVLTTNLNAQNFNEIIKTVASDRGAYDMFGYAVSISGDYAIVGAIFEDEDTSGASTLSDAGSAYIFERDGSGTWAEVQKIVASDRGADDRFGWSVSISGDYAIVGAYREDEDASGVNTLSGAGSAYIFERDGSGTWAEAQKIVAFDRGADDRFGWSVSISGDYAIVGAEWEDEDSSGANTLGYAGSAYIFERGGSGNWTEVQKIVASDRETLDKFGRSVSISGDYAIVGALLEDENAGGASTISDAGSAYIFERDGSGTWAEAQKIVASDRGVDDQFGRSVSISGDYAIVGTIFEDEDASGANTISDAGSAYVFERDGSGTWAEAQKIVASDRGAGDLFGISVSISGDYAIVGASREDEDTSGVNPLNDAGSAYTFERDGSGTWAEAQKIVASDRGADDVFGQAVSISGDYAIVGAVAEDEDASGANTLIEAGSAYIFESPSASSTTSNEISTSNDFSVYPNPADNYLMVSSSAYEPYSLKLIDISGKTIMQLLGQQNETKIDLSLYPSGVYFIHVKSTGETSSFKFVIKR